MNENQKKLVSLCYNECLERAEVEEDSKHIPTMLTDFYEEMLENETDRLVIPEAKLTKALIFYKAKAYDVKSNPHQQYDYDGQIELLEALLSGDDLL